MLKRLNLVYLGLLLGVAYWPFEAGVHALVFGNGTFIENLIHADADELWMRSLISVMFIGFGFHGRLMMEHQKQLHERLHKKSKRLHQIIDCSYDAYVSIDQHGVITGWNRSAETLFGWPVHRIIGEPIDRIIPESQRSAHHEGMRHYQQDRIGSWLYKPVSTRALHRDGFEFPIEMVVTPIMVNGNEEFFAFIREQSEQLQ